MNLLTLSATQAEFSPQRHDRRSQTGLELAIVDPSVDRWQQLVAGVRPECQVIILNPNDDGIEQITDILNYYRQIGHSIRSLHIISHGSPGCLDLGSGQLKLDNLDFYSQKLQQWRSALADHADILIYGCEFGAGEKTLNRLLRIQQLTGANIAASTTAIGHYSQGGNWQFDVCLGKITSSLAFTAATLSNYPSVLGLNFGAQSLFNVGTDPRSVAAGDLDNDGNLDLAIADQADGTVSLLLGDGTGNFIPQTAMTGFSDPLFVTIADFDNDNNQDIAVANSAAQDVRVLLGDGSGNNFPTQNTIALGGTWSPFSLAVGNFNGDANLDLVATKFGSGDISVLLGDGTGAFPTENPIAVGNDPQFVAVGNFDGNANQDLVVATDVTVNGSVLLGDGSGNFPSQNNFSGGGTNPRSVTVGDFNNDGDLDAAIANNGSNNVSIFTGNGAGVLTFANSFPVGNNPQFLVSEDFDGDGELDLAVANETDNNISILLGDGTGNFSAPNNFVVGTNPRSLVAGDFNNDNKADLAIANSGSDNVSILLNRTPKVAITPGTAPSETGSTPGNFTLTLDEPAPTGGLTVNFNLTGSTATNPDDYSLGAGTNITNLTANTLTIAAGATTAAIDIFPIDDPIDENAETVQLNLDIGNGYFMDAINNTANLAIGDNETSGVIIIPISGLTTSEAQTATTFRVKLQTQPTADVEINLNSDNPNEGTVNIPTITFNATNWNTVQTVTVTGTDDLSQDGDINYSIITSLISADANYNAIDPNDITLTNTDNDTAGVTINPTSGLTTTEAGGTATFDVVLNSQPTADVTINLNSDNPNEGTVNVPTITFNPTNWNTAQTVTVTGTDDLSQDGDINYSIITSLTSADANYNAIDPNDVTLTNTDNDSTAVLVDPINLNVTEGVSGVVNIRLNSQPTAPVTIAFNPGSQLNAIAAVTFTPNNWSQVQTIKITPANDALSESLQTEIINFNVSSADAKYNNKAIAPISVNIIDNDSPGLSIVQPVGNTRVLEGFGGDNYKIKLNTRPVADVEVAIATDGQVTSDLPTLTFTPENWQISQTVTVAAVDDGNIEGKHQSNISFQLTSADTQYNQLAILPLTVEVSDHEPLNNLFDRSAASPLTGISKLSIGGSELDDRIIGSNFADILYARQGNDILFGGNGDDILYGQFGDNGISGGEGEDAIVGSIGDDYLSGDNGDDKLFGSDGSDRIHGGNGNDSLIGENGNDRLFGDAGADILIGNGGWDAFAIGNGTGGMTIETADTIQDFTLGEDAIDLISGVTFADLTIVQGSGIYANDAIIQVTGTQEYLARLAGINASSLTQDSFL